jgi:preprotein translocase subunit YajC
MHRIILLLTALSVAYAESGGPADITPAPQPGKGADKAPDASSSLPTILLMVGIFAFMWFILIRPQRKEEKRRQELVASMRPGNQVVTIGGLHGEVVAVGEGTVDLKVGKDGTVMTFNKGAISTNLTAVAEAKK